MDRQTHTPKMYDFSCDYTVRSQQCTPHELMWIVLPQHRPVPQVALLQSEKDGNRDPMLPSHPFTLGQSLQVADTCSTMGGGS